MLLECLAIAENPICSTPLLLVFRYQMPVHKNFNSQEFDFATQTNYFQPV